MEPGVAVEQARSRREVENRKSNGREGKRARDPGKDGEHRVHEGDALGAEQRTAASDRTEGERQHAEPCGEVVAPHQEEQQGRTGEDRRLDDHAEVASCPSVGARAPGRRPVERRVACRPIRSFDFPIDGSTNAQPVQVPPDLDAPRLAREPRVEHHTPARFVDQVLSTEPAVRDDPGSRRGTAWRHARDLRRGSEIRANVGRTRLERKMNRGIAGERSAGACRPQIGPHQQDLHDGVEDGEADDADDGPGERGQSFEPGGFRGRGHAPTYYGSAHEPFLGLARPPLHRLRRPRGVFRHACGLRRALPRGVALDGRRDCGRCDRRPAGEEGPCERAAPRRSMVARSTMSWTT